MILDNAKNLGKDVLFIAMWIGAWGLSDLALASVSIKWKIGVYVLLLLIAAVTILFVGHEYT
jgi:hypothetical protein